MTIGGQWNVEAGWSELEASSTAPMQGDLRVFDTTLRTGDGAVLLALDASGLRHVLIPVADTFAPAHDRRSGGVHLVTRSLIDESGQRQFLDLACQKPHLSGVFAHLAEEALGSLCKAPANPLQACRQTLQRWRELLDREAPAILSTEALCGLFGELWHLAAVVNLNAGGINTWQGPNGARHDFAMDGLGLEVKATLRRDEWNLRIHGLTQLDKPENTTLYLCAMRLELNGASGVAVPDIIQQILEIGVDRHELISRLSLVGYDLRDEAHYRKSRFALLDLRLHEVSGDFPRLTASSFESGVAPTGVLDIHYTIDLLAAKTPPLGPEGLNRIHAALAGAPDAPAAGPAV